MPKRPRKSKTQRTARRRTKTPAKPSAERILKDRDRILRGHLVKLMRSGEAHLGFEQAVAGLPAELRGKHVEGLPFTIWSQVEHMRIALWDILEFSRDSKHVSPEWPKGYWPESDAPQDDAAWERSVAAIRSDMKAMEKLVQNPSTDLYRKIPHGTGQTILREAMVVANHNGYHLGQIVALRRLLGAWPD